MSEVSETSHTGSCCLQGESHVFVPAESQEDRESYGGDHLFNIVHIYYQGCNLAAL